MSTNPLTGCDPRRGRILGAGAVLCWALAGMPAARGIGMPGQDGDGDGGGPVLTGLFPPGVAIGTTTRWTVSGRHLGMVERFLVSGQGVTVSAHGLASDGRLMATVRVDPGAAAGFRELRVDGPSGVSNFVLFRVDSLPQLVESEPNDSPARANRLALGLAVAGVLEPRGLDHFVITGQEGGLMVLEIEARRLGTAITPIATVLTPSGQALMQAGESRGVDGDCRAIFRFPADGPYVVQVRDLLYRGGAGAAYRLRLTASPLATVLFPLGGVGGEPIEVSASGGTLTDVRRHLVRLPATPGAIVDPGPFEGRGAPVVVAQRMFVGEGTEVREGPAGPDSRTTTRLPLGSTANGRIDRAGERDTYLVPARRGDRIRLSVRAASLGSWLDSVVTLRDGRGEVLAEDDDPAGPATSLVRPRAAGPAPASPDSLLEHEAAEDGDLRVEIGDRYGDGGPEYAYRLSAALSEPDLSLEFAPMPDEPAVGIGGRSGVAADDSGRGVLNMAPGATRRIRVAVAARGRVGPIVLRARGLPSGVAAEPVTIRPPAGRGRPGNGPAQAPAMLGILTLRADPEAKPALGELRIEASAARPDGSRLVREGTTTIVMDWAPLSGASRPVTREAGSLPLKVTGGRAHRPVVGTEARGGMPCPATPWEGIETPPGRGSTVKNRAAGMIGIAGSSPLPDSSDSPIRPMAARRPAEV